MRSLIHLPHSNGANCCGLLGGAGRTVFAPRMFFIWIIYQTPLSCFAAAPFHCMPSGLHCTCFSLVYSSATQFRCLGFAPVALFSTTAAVQMSRFLLPPPPLSFPTPCRSPGGGDHLVNPNFFVAAHCVVVWVAVLWGTTTCIPCTHGRTFCSLSLKWNLTTQPCFPLGQV